MLGARCSLHARPAEPSPQTTRSSGPTRPLTKAAHAERFILLFCSHNVTEQRAPREQKHNRHPRQVRLLCSFLYEVKVRWTGHHVVGQAKGIEHRQSDPPFIHLVIVRIVMTASIGRKDQEGNLV